MMMYSKLMTYRRVFFGIMMTLLFGGLLLCVGGCGTAALSAVGAAAPDKTLKSAANRPMRLYLPEASGTVVYEGAGVSIDASNTSKGYFMVKSAPNERRLKLRVTCEEQVYNYDLPSGGDYAVFPCQMGSGIYLARVMENVEADLYAQLFAAEFEVKLEQPNAPFLYPSQYVDFHASSEVVARSYLLVEGLGGDEEIVKKLYRFVVKNTDYDYDKAATVKSGYLPDPDETLRSGKGICFDYSALLASMLRAQGIPAQLVVGMVMPEGITHAWNRVFIDGEWVWMDATFDGTGHKEKDYTTERVY